MNRVAVFTNQVLPYSEIFILEQMRHLRRFDAELIGCRRARHSAPLPSSVRQRLTILGPSEAYFFKLSGYSSRLSAAFAKADLIHAHFGPNGYLAARLAARLKRPLIVSCHGYEATINAPNLRQHGITHWLFAKRRGALARRCEMFLCVSDYIRKRMIERGFPAHKCRTHYIGIDTTTIKGLCRPDAKAEAAVVAVGRLVPYKGHELLIDAMAEVQQVVPGASLTIVGDGPLLRQLRERATKRLRQFRFTGVLSHADTLHEIAQAKILCHPSQKLPNGHTEALGLVVLEAQALGVPVVVFDSGGTPEAVAHSRTGVVVSSTTTRALAAALLELLRDEGWRQQLATAAPGFVAEHFDLRKQTSTLEDIYQDTIRARRPGSAARPQLLEGRCAGSTVRP